LVGARSADEVRDAADMLALAVSPALWDELRAEGLLPKDGDARKDGDA
jgi:D-threo-aldose 1-dehydrogenase